MRQPTSDLGQSAARRAPGGQAGAEFRLPALVGQTVAKVERDLIIHTVEHCRGNRTHAASILGISIRTLRNKLRAYGEGCR
jgi:two-component system, response regulator FlrC